MLCSQEVLKLGLTTLTAELVADFCRILVLGRALCKPWPAQHCMQEARRERCLRTSLAFSHHQQGKEKAVYLCCNHGGERDQGGACKGVLTRLAGALLVCASCSMCGHDRGQTYAR